MDRQRALRLKLKDYQFFIAVLLIISSYLYMGAIFNMFSDSSKNGIDLLLLSFIMTVTGLGLQFHRNRLKKKLEQNEH